MNNRITILNPHNNTYENHEKCCENKPRFHFGNPFLYVSIYYKLQINVLTQTRYCIKFYDYLLIYFTLLYYIQLKSIRSNAAFIVSVDQCIKDGFTTSQTISKVNIL